MDKSRVFLAKIGGWIWYKFYFDLENNCFIEERYHEEYLDTGTIFEGSSAVTAEYVYKTFVEHTQTEAIDKMLEYVDNFELPPPSEKQMSEEEFFEKLKEFDIRPAEGLEKIDNTYVLSEKGKTTGVLSKTKHFYIFDNTYGKNKGFIYQNEAFAYIIDLLKEDRRIAEMNRALSLAKQERLAAQKTDDASNKPKETISTLSSPIPEKKVSIWLRIIWFIVPLLGLLHWVFKSNTKPKEAKAAGLSGAVGVVVWTIIFYVLN